MNDNNYVGSFNLKEVIIRILYRWRRIIIYALFLSILFAGYKLIMLLLTYNNVSNDEKNIYKNELSTYNENKKTIEDEINKLESNIMSLNEYLNNSIFMQIDHYNEQIGNLSYYIDTDYQINPKLTYQNRDNTNTVKKAYLSLLQNGDLYKYIIDRLPYDIEARYLKELFTIWDDDDSNLIYIQVIHKNKEACNEIMHLVQDYLMQKKAYVTQTIGEHSISLVNTSVQQYVDLALYNVQDSKRQLLKEYESKINEYETMKSDLQEPVLIYQGYKSFVYSVIKFAVLGFVLGIIIVIAIEVALIMFGNTLLSVNEYRRMYNIHILGQISRNSRKSRFKKVDKIINRLDGNLDLMDDESETIRRICTIIKMLLKEAEINEGAIVITGTAHYRNIENIGNEINVLLENKYKIYPCANINYSAETVEIISNCKAMLLVEEVGYSTYTEITRELENLVDINRKVIGTVIIK